MGLIEMTQAELLEAQTEALAQYECVGDEGEPSEGKHWWLVKRMFEDGRTLYLYPCGSGVSLGVSDPGDDFGYREVYDFFDLPMFGWVAGLRWDGKGEPFGWNRAHRAGYHTRRRVGGFGDEYVDEHELRDYPNVPRWYGPGKPKLGDVLPNPPRMVARLWREDRRYQCVPLPAEDDPAGYPAWSPADAVDRYEWGWAEAPVDLGFAPLWTQVVPEAG